MKMQLNKHRECTSTHWYMNVLLGNTNGWEENCEACFFADTVETWATNKYCRRVPFELIFNGNFKFQFTFHWMAAQTYVYLRIQHTQLYVLIRINGYSILSQ